MNKFIRPKPWIVQQRNESRRRNIQRYSVCQASVISTSGGVTGRVAATTLPRSKFFARQHLVRASLLSRAACLVHQPHAAASGD